MGPVEWRVMLTFPTQILLRLISSQSGLPARGHVSVLPELHAEHLICMPLA